MNTSDQNVFTLDTAFQRRWNMRLIRNEFGNDGIETLFVPGIATTWGDFWKAINDKIVGNNNGLSSEDKRLGTHFVKKSDLATTSNYNDKEMAERFAEKVYRYLWDDAFKMNKYDIFLDNFKTLEDVLDKVSYEMDKQNRYELKDIFKIVFSVTPSGSSATLSGISATPSGTSVTPSGTSVTPSGGSAIPSGSSATSSGTSAISSGGSVSNGNEDEINQQKENKEIGDTSDTPEKQLPEENGNSEE